MLNFVSGIYQLNYLFENHCFLPTGHIAIHIPQILAPPSSLNLPNSVHCSLHLQGSKNSSLLILIFHNLPFPAFTGQIFTHRSHFPHRLVSTGADSDLTGVLTSIDTSRSLGPIFFETNRSVFPIHPSPALVATILCDSSA